MNTLTAHSTAALSESATLRARSTPLESPTDGVLMYMPGGVSQVHLGVGGQNDAKARASIWIKVDRESAAALQASLSAYTSEFTPQRAYFDKEHEGKDATGWPLEFFWSETPKPGIYARYEKTALGSALIDGKIQRGFSGQFRTDADLPKRSAVRAGQSYTVPDGRRGSQGNPARLTSIDFPIAGGFTNFPAFTDNLPLWGRHAGSSSTAPTPKHTADPMKKTKATLEAEIQQCTNDIAELTARDQSIAENVEALNQRNRDLDLFNAQMEALLANEQASLAQQSLTARHAVDAQAAVAQAVARGAIKQKDEVTKKNWIDLLTSDPAKIVLLASLAGSVALGTRQDTPPTRLIPSGVHMHRENPEAALDNISSLTARSHGLFRKDDFKSQKEIGDEIGQLYASRIRPMVENKEYPVLRASNSLGTLAETLVSMRTLENLVLSMPLLSRVGSSFSDQIVSYGDALKTRFVLAPSVVTYHTTNGWSDSDDVTTDVSITYDKYKGVQIMLTAQDIAGTARKLFEEIAPMQAYALGKDIVDTLYAVITYAAFAGETNLVGGTAAERSVGLGSFGRSTLVDLSGDLDDNGNPDMGRFCLLARPYWSALKKDQTIIALATQQQGRIIEKGVLPDIEDFDVIKATNLPATAINGKTLKGFAGTKSSLLYATRLSADYINAMPGAGNGILQVVSLGDTGISANLVQYVDNKLGRAYRRLEIIYGVAAGRELAGQLLTDV